MCPAQLPAVISRPAAKPPQLSLQPTVPAAMVGINFKAIFREVHIAYAYTMDLHQANGTSETAQQGHRLRLQNSYILRTSVSWELFGKSYFSWTKKSGLFWFSFSYFELPVASENPHRVEGGNTSPVIPLKLWRYHFLWWF